MRSFEITEDHLKLASRMYVDAGQRAPEVNQQRPYGNSDIVVDVRMVLGRDEPCPTCGNKPSSVEEPTDEEELQAIHDEMPTVLQIILSTRLFQTGHYEMSQEYESRSWYLVSS